MNRKTAVLGGGSLGLLLAFKLIAAGLPCVLWTRTREQADRLNRDGLILQNAEGETAGRVTVESRAWDGEGTDGAELVLLAVKQTALEPAFLERLARAVPLNGTVVPFQNGIGHVAKLRAALPGRSVVAAVTTEGALRIDETTVRHTGRGEIRIGGDGEPESAPEVARLLKEAGFSAFLSNDWEESILRKLLVNAAINPLTAILRIANGGLAESSERLALTKALFEETYGILRDCGLGLPEAEGWNEILRVCRATSGNRSSMLQDVLAGRPTEIDAINGEIVRMAERLGRDAPWNRAVTALVKAIGNSINVEKR